MAARSNVALASPTPSNCVKSSHLNIKSLLVNDAAPAFPASVITSMPRRALPKQNGQQFLIAQTPRAFAEKFFSRAIRLGNLVDSFAHAPHAAADKMSLDHRDGHDVEDAAGVRVFGVGQFLVTSPLVVGRLNLAVDLSAICAFEIDAVVPVRVDGGADDRVGRFSLR